MSSAAATASRSRPAEEVSGVAMTRDTKIRLALAVMVFMMVQAVLFGFGMMAVLQNPNQIGESDFFGYRL